MTFALVSAEEAVYPKALMCRALGLSRSGHHAFRTRKASPRALARQRLDVQVAAVFKEKKGRYGAPRIEKQLRKDENGTSKKRVAASMRRQGLVARPRRRWRTTTDSGHKEPVAPNLLDRHSTWRYLSDAEPELFAFIESYYNQERLHSSNGYKTPNEVETDQRDGALAT